MTAATKVAGSPPGGSAQLHPTEDADRLARR
jgi:hypothetical protein